jgi:hypothetical protein
MARYRHDDPRLDEVIAEQASQGAANWPAPTPQQISALAPLLAPPPVPATARRRRTRTATARRRAA